MSAAGGEVRLNKEQRAAVDHRGGPLLILAGPGTGKTTVLVARAVRVVQDEPAGDLLLLTFTRAARHQLQERLDRQLGERAERVTAATFHSLAWRIVSRLDSRLLLDGRSDYSTVMKVAAHLAQSQRCELQHEWLEVMVDEFQDTDYTQYALVTALTPATRRLTVVGDDDQAIYGWRGAVPNLFHRFREEHPSLRTIVLTRNYRAHSDLVRATNQIAAAIPERLPKQLRAADGLGPRPHLIRPLSQGSEASLCLREIRNTLSAGENSAGKSMPAAAVIYRLRRAARPLIQLLDQQNIPYVRLDEGETLPMLQAAPAVCADLLAYRRAALLAAKPFGSWTAAAQLPTTVRRRELQPLRSMAPQQAVPYICRVLGYEQALYRRQGPGQDLDAAAAVLERAAAMERWQQVEDLEQTARTPSPLILTTAHSAKGLEFRQVWVIGAIDGWFPLTRVPAAREARDDSWRAEERRLFYVACTRAAEKLTISAPRLAPWGPAGLTPFLPGPLVRDIKKA